MKYSKHLFHCCFPFHRHNFLLFTSFIAKKITEILGSRVDPNLFHLNLWMTIVSSLGSLWGFFFMQHGQGLTDISTVHINSIFSINNLLPFSQIFQGNTNPTDVAKTMLPKPTLTRFVRIRPVTWETGIALRFEVYGCKISGGWSACTLTHAPQLDLCSQVINSTHIRLVWQVLFCLLCIPIVVPVAQTLPGVRGFWISLLRVE